MLKKLPKNVAFRNFCRISFADSSPRKFRVLEVDWMVAYIEMAKVINTLPMSNLMGDFDVVECA